MIDAVVYDAERGVRTFETDPEADDAAGPLAAARAATGTTWVRAHDADEAELGRVAAAFDVHPLVVEDVVNDVRPKTEEFGAYTVCLLKAAELRSGDRPFDEEVRADPVGVVLGPDWLVTMSTARLPAVDRVHEAVVSGNERLLQRGPDFTAYRALDAVVEGYFDLLDDVETAIESIEEGVVEATDPDLLASINAVRRDLLAFRKVVWPAREAVGVFARGEPAQVAPDTEKYYRDLYDDLVGVVDLTETYRDLVGGARDLYLNTLSQSTNDVMKTLTVVATIFLPLTFIAGVYGMNFADSPYNMPELGWTFGYPAVMLGMALVAVLMLRHFRRQEYL